MVAVLCNTGLVHSHVNLGVSVDSHNRAVPGHNKPSARAAATLGARFCKEERDGRWKVESQAEDTCCFVRAFEPFFRLACMEKAFDKLYGKLKHEAIKIKRQAKAVAELETPFERNLREATSNKRWGCPNSVLHELAIDAQTYKFRQKIMARSFENLNGNQDKWRRILKTLILLEYLIKNGSDSIADELRGEQLTFRRLANFQCKDEGQDRGSGVREKAEALVKLLNDKDFLKLEREQAKLHHTKLTGSGPTAIVGGRGSQSTSSTSSVSSVLGDALNELRPGNDSRTLSSSQAAELERRFNRLKEEQLAERVARERNFKTQGHAPPQEAAERAEGGDGRPREDRYGLFDPSFAPQDCDSDSDASPSRPTSVQAQTGVDLLDMDADDARQLSEGPARSAFAQNDFDSGAHEDWTNFCTPSTGQTSFSEQAPAAEHRVDVASLMDLTSSTSTPSTSLLDPSSHAQSGAEQDPFEGMEFKSAVAGFGPSEKDATPGQRPAMGYANGDSSVPIFKGEPAGQAPLSGTFLDGLGVAVDMLSLDEDRSGKNLKEQKPLDPLASLDGLQCGQQPR